MEEPGELQSMGLQRIGHIWAYTHTQEVIIYELRWFLEFKKEKRGQRLNEHVFETKEIEKKAAVK